jgi:hypothetical protein
LLILDEFSGFFDRALHIGRFFPALGSIALAISNGTYSVFINKLLWAPPLFGEKNFFILYEKSQGKTTKIIKFSEKLLEVNIWKICAIFGILCYYISRI